MRFHPHHERQIVSLFPLILGAIFPVFGLILLGFGCGRLDILGPRAFEVLNRFVISITLPVLTFRTLAHMQSGGSAVPAMIVAVSMGALLVYAFGFLLERMAGRCAVDANIAALGGCYSNTGFVGLPIALIALGPDSLAPVAISMALYGSVVFGLAVFVSEVGRSDGELKAGLKRATHALSRHPLIIMSVLGVAWAALVLPLPKPIDTLLETLAAATAPCALVAIGLFTALPRTASAPGAIARVTTIKLVLHPLVTAGVVLFLPSLPPVWAATAILMAAMPAGASSFVLAGGAGKWAMEVSAWALTLSTTLAALSLAAVLWLLGSWIDLSTLAR